jgi:hypothetical protein
MSRRRFADLMVNNPRIAATTKGSSSDLSNLNAPLRLANLNPPIGRLMGDSPSCTLIRAEEEEEQEEERSLINLNTFKKRDLSLSVGYTFKKRDLSPSKETRLCGFF